MQDIFAAEQIESSMTTAFLVSFRASVESSSNCTQDFADLDLGIVKVFPSKPGNQLDTEEA
jgi:hypothetical protein